MNLNNYMAFGICGYSGSGKTTLIEALILYLKKRGLRACVIKQDTHGLEFDRDGKDTDRIFNAGADICIRDSMQSFTRTHRTGDDKILQLIDQLAPNYDLFLVEGHKSSRLPYKIWLCRPEETKAAPEANDIQKVLQWTDDRETIAKELLDKWLEYEWQKTPVYAGVLTGGMSSRMGTPKHLININGTSWLEHTVAAVRPHVDNVILLGNCETPLNLRSLPLLPDVQSELGGGPLLGMQSAMRWAPRTGWIFVACDQPNISTDAVHWILTQRKPGVRAVMPMLSGRPAPEPLFAYYDFRIAPVVERVHKPCDIAAADGVVTPAVPKELEPAWNNINTPEDLNNNNRG